METKKAKTMVVAGLLALAALAVIFLPAFAGAPEPIARPGPKRQGVYKIELPNDLPITTLEEECGAAEAIGHSESFSFDEAFMNALHSLPEDTTPVYPDKMSVVTVVEVGARFGGFAGFNHMYVRVRRAADPACLNSKKKQEAEPGVEGEPRMQQGKMKKLPGRKFKIGEVKVTEPKPIEEK